MLSVKIYYKAKFHNKVLTPQNRNKYSRLQLVIIQPENCRMVGKHLKRENNMPTIAEKKAALEAQLNELREEEKAEEIQRYAVLGRIVTEEMQSDADLNNRFNTLLSSKLKKNNERALFGLEKIASNRGRKATVDA